MSGNYHQTRLSQDARRDMVWEILWDEYFSKRVPRDGCVLDIGAGYGQFINNVDAKRRIALDQWGGMVDHLEEGVEAIIGDLQAVKQIEAGAVDYAFASNIFEHVTQEALAEFLDQLRPILSQKGSLTILQPNYRYASKEYFDDYTHISIWSHVGMHDFLEAHGYEVTYFHPRFLPLTVKSRLPVFPFLIKAYLASPIRPMGKQMLFVAKPK